MPRWGMVIDLDKCTACQACTVACKSENNVPFQEEDQTSKGRGMYWMQVLAAVEGEYPSVRIRLMPRPCMHCDKPPCVQVCPVAATHVDKDGSVVQRNERCIGCRYCMVACPYGVRYFNWFAPTFPETMSRYINPRVEVRRVGIVEKCTFCVQRRLAAEAKALKEGREVRDGDVVTACQQTCTGRAISFGDLDNPQSTVYKLSKDKRAFRLLEEVGTEPKVYYLKEG